MAERKTAIFKLFKFYFMNYYEKQLAQINTTNKDFAPTIKVYGIDASQDTKHISINKESARALIEWLNKNYINKP